MGEELRIIREHGGRLLLTLTGRRVTPGGVMSLTATLGENVLANLPLPKGPVQHDRGGAAPPQQRAGRRAYAPRRSLAELIRQSIKRLQDGEAGPVRGSAVVPGTRKVQAPLRAQGAFETTTASVASQDWEYDWTVSFVGEGGAAAGPAR